MVSKRWSRVAVALVVAGVAAVTGCQELRERADLPPDALRGHLIGAGASSQGSAQEAWVVGFQLQNPGVTITYDPIGSGGGRETFQSGAAMFAASDRAFRVSEIEEGRFDACVEGSGIWQIPAYLSPIAIIYNVEGVTALNLDADAIAGIFTGAITRWNDSAIVRQNPGERLPDLNITAVHRSDKSGTTGNFADYLSKAAPEVWVAGGKNAGPTEEWFPEWGGEGAPQTSGVVDTVANGVGTIGYVDASRTGDLGVVSVKVGDQYVSYTPEAAAAIVDASPMDSPGQRGPNDFTVELDRTTAAAGTYPIVLVSYLIGCNEYRNPEIVPLVKGFVGYVVSEEGQAFAQAYAGNAPISSPSRERALTVMESIR
jgi:phosphate transport system substrate-binding protein